METNYSRLCRMQALDREHRRAMYGWTHPQNVARIEARLSSGGDRSVIERCMHLEASVHELESLCRTLQAKVDELQAAGRQHAGVAFRRAAEQRPASEQRDAEPVVIRRRGEGGQTHAK